MYSFREWKDPSTRNIGERIFEDLINYRSRCEEAPGQSRGRDTSLYPPSSSIWERERESLPFEALPKLCLHTLHLRCRDLSTGPRRFLSSARSSGRWASLLIPAPRSADENSAGTRLCVNSHSVDRLLQPFDGWYNYLARELTTTSRAAYGSFCYWKLISRLFLYISSRLSFLFPLHFSPLFPFFFFD